MSALSPPPDPGTPLSRQPERTLGAMRVRPSLCEVEFDGATEHLEPRVMQVLVALARAEGAVLSRDDLIAQCWDGRIVGEDAINRVISRIRRLSAGGARGFAVETFPRVGYRLTLTEPTSPVAVVAPEAPARPAHRRPNVRRSRIGLAVGGLALVVVAGVFASRQTRPAEWRVDGYEVLSDAPGWERKPDLSPDGRFVVYSAQPTPEEQNGDIYMRNVSGGDPIRLVAGPWHENAPAFSPDGDRIAFIRTSTNYEAGERPREPCRLVVKPVPDGPERVVGRCPRFPGAGTLDWTANGLGLVFTDVDRQGTGRIMRLDIGTGAVRPLTSPAPGHRDFNGADSPDGRRLAFVRMSSEGAGDVWIQDLRSSRLTRATEHNAFISNLDWTPDGRSLLFSSGVDGGGDLWSAPVSGRGRPQRLLVGLRAVGRLSTAPGLTAVETLSISSRLVRRGVEGESEVAAFAGTVRGLDVSRNGDVAFLTEDAQSWLWLQRPGEPARRHLRLGLTLPRSVRWSPDGRALAFVADVDGRAHVHVLQLEGGGPRRLPAPAENLRWPTWTQGGRALAFSGRDASGWRIWRMGLEAGAEARAITPPGFGFVHATSDGALYASAPRLGAAVWRLQASGPPVQVAPEGEDRWWTVNDQGVLFWPLKRPGVWLLPFAGGPAKLFGQHQSVRDDLAAVDPRTGDILHAEVVREEQDLGLLRLSRE